MPIFDGLNYIAILLAAIASMVIGALWYSPLLFAKPWMRMIGKTEEDLKKDGGMGSGGLNYAIAMGGSLIAAFILAQFVYLMDAKTIVSGIKLGLWIWVGFTATSTFTHYSFSGRPLKLALLDAGYFLVTYTVMGAILAGWR
jgi:hypothetical protein